MEKQKHFASNGRESNACTPTLVHLRCVRTWCWGMRGLDGSTVLRVDLLLLSDDGWFWERAETIQVATLHIDTFI